MGPMSRREMLKRLGTAMGVATVLPLPAAVRARAQTAIAESFISCTPAEAETLRAIVARLLPAAARRPGALDARAHRYIARALSGALKSSRAAYTPGLASL